ncbi:DUF3253 domain-containing protein [Alkalicaulis satelles]|uniref:DUF3253 domain-containing protein n=1 Tax=Alkalicaulis satelles TaxID=2609175 RepID=A0A5M6ZF27_9PROT|nr:DUF3253 domain-containing protein [Alkalicaulis satelles]KAA5801708.1 DUF3253 domain-containing protein [Alkalicaulis satelles]
MSEDRIETAILTLAEQRGSGKSICPSEAAREAFPQDWHGRMRHVRAAAVHLARQGRVVILRKGKPVDPENFKGVYRIAIAPDAPAAPDAGV